MSSYAFRNNCCVQVTGIKPGCIEPDLFYAFQDVGRVKAILMDSPPGVETVNATVEFEKPEQAELAVKMKNGCEIAGAAVRVVLLMDESEPTAATRTNKVFVRNLPTGVDENVLIDAFRGFGNVLGARIGKSSDEKLLNYGWVQMEDEGVVGKVLEIAASAQGISVSGTRIEVEKYKRKEERNSNSVDKARHFDSADAFTNLFVKNLPLDCNEEAFVSVFQKFGPVLRVRISRDPVSGQSRGFGYLEFERPSSAAEAVKEMNGSAIFRSWDQHIEPLFVERYFDKRQRSSVPKVRPAEPVEKHVLYVANLPQDMMNLGLFGTFKSYGNVLSAEVEKSTGKIQVRHGLVTFATRNEAQAALEAVNGKLVGGNRLIVTWYSSSPEISTISEKTVSAPPVDKPQSRPLHTLLDLESFEKMPEMQKHVSLAEVAQKLIIPYFPKRAPTLSIKVLANLSLDEKISVIENPAEFKRRLDDHVERMVASGISM